MACSLLQETHRAFRQLQGSQPGLQAQEPDDQVREFQMVKLPVETLESIRRKMHGVQNALKEFNRLKSGTSPAVTAANCAMHIFIVQPCASRTKKPTALEGGISLRRW